MPPNAVCNLGSLDLSKYVVDGQFDFERLSWSARLATRFLDDVIDAQEFPTADIQQFAMEFRPVGVGVMGFADALLAMGVAYGSDESLELLEEMMRSVYNGALAESEMMVQERGVPVQCQKLPKPRRNITLTTVAPTGTISLLAGCSSGIEPVFSEITMRTDGTGTYQLVHPQHDRPYFRCAVSANGASEVTWYEHIGVQYTAQKFVDAAVSKTINFPQHTRRETIWDAFTLAWKTGCIKGLTVYRNQSRKVEVLTPKNLKRDKCPVCGEDLVREDGCKHCSKCEYSVCEIS